MKKSSLLFVLALFFVAFSTAYSQVSVVVNAGVRMPTGDLKDVVNTGYGIAVTGEFSLPTAPVIIEVTAGLDNFKYSGQTTTSYKLQVIPIMGGVKYMIKTPGNMLTPYIGGRLGMVNASTDVPNTSSESAFAWSPEAGIRYAFSPNLSLDVNAFYLSSSKNGSTSSWFGASAGVAFGL